MLGNWNDNPRYWHILAMCMCTLVPMFKHHQKWKEWPCLMQNIKPKGNDSVKIVYWNYCMGMSQKLSPYVWFTRFLLHKSYVIDWLQKATVQTITPYHKIAHNITHNSPIILPNNILMICPFEYSLHYVHIPMKDCQRKFRGRNFRVTDF